MKHLHLLVWTFVVPGIASGAGSEIVPPDIPWQVSLERTDFAGTILAQTKVQISVPEAGGSPRGQMMINMAGDAGKRFWTVNFETAPKEGFWSYGITDSGLIQETFTDGNSSTIQVYMCEANVPWKGAGRYPIMVFGKDRLVLEFKPLGHSGDSLPVHVAPMWIELTQKNASGDLLARSSAPWFAINGDRVEVDLAWPTHFPEDSKTEPIARTFHLWEEPRGGLPSGLRVRMKNWGLQTGHLRARTSYDLLLPLKTTDAMLVYEQDGEIVEATIRPPGKTESPSK